MEDLKETLEMEMENLEMNFETDSGEILQCKPEIDIESGEGKETYILQFNKNFLWSGIAIEKRELYEEEKHFDRPKKEDRAEIGYKERQDGFSLEAARSSYYNFTFKLYYFSNNATKLMRNETTVQKTFFPIKSNKLPKVCSPHPILTLEIDQPLPFRYGYFGLKQGVDQTIELEGDINPEKEGESQQRSNIIPSSNETSEGKQEEYKPHFAVPLEKHDEKTEYGKAEAVIDRSPLVPSSNETSEGKQEENKPHFAVPLEKHDKKTEYGKAEAVLDRSPLVPKSYETSEGKREEFKPHFAVPLEKHDEKTEYGKAEAVLDRSPLDVALNKKRRKGVTWRRLFRCILQWLFKLCIGLGFIFCIYLFFSEVQKKNQKRSTPGRLDQVEGFESLTTEFERHENKQTYHQAHQRTKRNTGGNNYHVTKYKLLIDGVECPLVKSIRCEKDGEKPVCIRNKTRKNLVIACVTNITMTNGCPVFVEAKNATHVDLTLVQFEDIIDCSSCPTEVYGLHDVENYPTCLTLDTPFTTTDASAMTTNPAVKKKQDANVLHGGIIAGIIVAFTVVLLVVLVILLILYGFRRMMKMICQTPQMIPIPQSDFV